MDSSQRTVPVLADRSKCWQTQREVVWDKTWQAIDEKKTQKMKKEQLSFTEEDYAQLMAEYKANAKEDKKLRKEDKAIWIESKL